MHAKCPSCSHVFEIVEDGLTPLRQARLDKKIKIEEAAEEIGMSHWALSRLERGFGNPKMSVLKSITRFYGKSMDELFPDPLVDDEEDEPAEAPVEEIPGNDEDEFVPDPVNETDE